MEMRTEEQSIDELSAENALLHEEVDVARRASEITASLVVDQFVKMEEIHQRLEDKVASEHKMNEYLAVLHETTLGLISHLDLNELLETLVIRAGQLVGTSHGFISLVESEEAALGRKVGVGVFSHTNFI